MPSQATIILHKKESSLDARLASLARFFGIESRANRLAESRQRDEFLAGETSSGCVMVSATSLAAILQDKNISRDAVVRAFEVAPYVLVYGITAAPDDISAVQSISHGAVSSVRRFDAADYAYQVNGETREITGEFTNLRFGPIKKEIDCGLVTDNPAGGLSGLVSIDGLPFFASVKRPQSELFLLACGDVADLAAKTDASLPASEYFSRVVPVLMFLRRAFGDQAWHNTTRIANLIIDDPLLRKSYGFLDYRQLLAEMDRSRFSSTIAFIPWNYKRTSRAIAKLVKQRADRFSICVHGCDHTGGEFSSTDVSELDRRSGLAMLRMRAHEQRTGVPCDDVMVFPQGKFSSVSLGVLKKHNFLAAVNSTVKPLDLGDAHGITLGELLEPAVSRYGSFPLFMRRYPGELVNFAFDLFLGKPALVVEHHGYFKGGYDKVRDFMTQLNALSPDLRWMGLGDLLGKTHLERSVSPGVVECKIFTNYQIIENPTPAQKTFIILKPEDNRVSIKEVTVDGRSHPFAIENGHLKLSVEIPALSAAKIRISYAGASQNGSGRQSVMREAKVFLRRHLSELRDNHLAKHPKVLALAYRVKNGKSPVE
jgi:hypothetical protein